MEKNKVCIITTAHSPFDVRIFQKQAKTLVDGGYDVTLIAQHDKPEVVEDINIVPLQSPKSRFSRMVGLTFQAYRLALKQDADLYHFHDPEFILFGMLLKLASGFRVIYDVHEDVPKQILTKDWIPGFFRKPVAKLFDYLEKYAARIFNVVVTATEDIASNFTCANPVVIHNYPRIKMFSDSKENENVPHQQDKSLVYVGGITKNRGIKEMVKALGHINDQQSVKLELIGEFQNRQFEKELEGMPEYEYVRFLGWFPWKRAWDKAQHASAGILPFLPLPNHLNALPNKLFEYMAAGLPVVASDFSLWEEIVVDNNCGIMVNPEEPESIAEGVKYVIDNPNEAREMAQNGKALVQERYNWSREGEKLLKLYDRLS